MFKNFLKYIGLSKKSQVRTRFAPSPTGFLHIGGLRTALYSYLFAKQNQGQFILRLEDTDVKRYIAGTEKAIYEGLKWAGLKYNEGPDIGGPFGPYVQSQRLEIYKKYANNLLKRCLAYRCFCDAKTLEEIKKEQMAKKQAAKYDRRCLKLSKEEIEEKLKNNAPYVLRMKILEGRKIEFDDLVRGKIVYNSDELDDQVLLKSDGYPTYHLAVVVDDYLMKISHVTRTEEWLPSTPKHILLYEYFGWEKPQWAHLPLLLNPDKTKMSKRQGDVALGDYIKKGYLPEAMVNYLAFLGWNPGTEKEIYSMEELLMDFDLKKVHKASAVFNLEKLNWFNAYYLRRLPENELLEKCRPYLLSGGNFSDRQLIKILNLEKERSSNFYQIGENVRFFFELPAFDKNMIRWKEMTDEEIKNSLEKSKEIISAINEKDFSAKNLSERFLAEAQNFKNRGELLWPLRVALSGQKNSPPPFEIAEILGKKESSERITVAIRKI